MTTLRSTLRARPGMRLVGAGALMLVATFVTSYLTVHNLRIAEYGAAIVWPAAGLAVVILVRCPRRWWFALSGCYAVGHLSASLTTHSAPIAITYVCTSLIEILVAGTVLTTSRRHGRAGMRTFEDGLRFAAAMVVAIGVGVVLIAATSSLLLDNYMSWSSVVAYAVGHAVGMVLFAPMLMLRSAPQHQGRWRGLEFVLVLLGGAALTCWVFLNPSGLYFPYSIFIPVIWASMRFPSSRAMWVVAVVLGAASYGTAQGRGPFVVLTDMTSRGLTAQLFLATLAGTSVAVVIINRHRVTLAERARASEAALGRAIRDSTAGTYSIWLDADQWGLIRDANPAFATMLGYRTTDLIGQPCWMLGARDDANLRTVLEGYLRQLAEGTLTGYQEESQFYRADGEKLWVQTNLAVVRPVDGQPFALVHAHDLTLRERNRAELEHLALHDALTGLANRTLLFQRLTAALGTGSETFTVPGNAATDRAARAFGSRAAALAHGGDHGRNDLAPTLSAVGGIVGVLYLDLDGFKLINDRYGHAAGDAVLVTVAKRLVGAARPADTVARLGGDEFAVLCPSLPDVDALADIADRMRSLVTEPIRLPQGALVTVDVSVGEATATEPTDADMLLRAADQAMYLRKSTHRQPEAG